VSEQKRMLAFVAYLLGILGWLYVLLCQRRSRFAVYHAKQSLGLTLVAVATPAIWAVGAWLFSWIPLAGPLVAATGFSLVILAYVVLGVAWITGMANALSAKTKPLPLVGKWMEQVSIEPSKRRNTAASTGSATDG
jgi:uncharacterized membrane protein